MPQTKATIHMLDSSGEPLAPTECSFVNLDVMESPPPSFTQQSSGAWVVAQGVVWGRWADAYAAQKASCPEVVRREDYIDLAESALLAGADYMETHGYAIGADCEDDGRVCLRGAIAQQSTPGLPHLLPHHRLAIDLVAEYLNMGVDDHPVSWNDRTGRELGQEVAQKEIVETMRLAHEKSRRDRGLLP